MNIGDLNMVWEVKPLKKPGEEEARRILEKIAKHVQPIMKKHKWRVKLLSEFSPSNPALLGLNVGGGVEVKIRLRRPNRDWDFIPYNQVLDTMLHELCHNDHGPHNAAFYKLWDDVRKECEGLISNGISGSGEGFDSTGRRLGGVSHQPPLTSLRQAALAAAEKRSRLGTLLPSGPKRLGGDSDIMGALSPLQAAAMAAERRMQDELWCGSQPPGASSEAESSSSMSQGKSGETSKLSSNSKPSDGSSWRNIPVSDNLKEANVLPNVLPESGVKGSVANDLTLNPRGTSENSLWECGICTLLNPALAPVCEACGIQRPNDEGTTKFKTWSCKFCTLDNSVKLDNCSACGQWRYSYGAPASSQLNRGT